MNAATPASPAGSPPPSFCEDVELSGHIIDSLLLPKVLDEITGLGGEYQSHDIRIGHNRHDPSYIRLTVTAPTLPCLEKILTAIGQHGAVPVQHHDCRLEPADMEGAFPEGFYATTNEQSEIRLNNGWIPVMLRKWTAASPLIERIARRVAWRWRMSNVATSSSLVGSAPESFPWGAMLNTGIRSAS